MSAISPDPQGAAALGVTPESPWLGLRPFSEEVRDYFYGRDAEIQDLHERVLHRPLTLLFGQSGLGKTSLLRAGLVPLLRQEGFLPILIRLLHEPGAPALEEQVVAEIHGELARTSGSESSPLRDVGLWQLFHDPIYGLIGSPTAGPLQPILIFDQFEEIFTHGMEKRPADARSFIEALACLVENRPPAALRAQIDADDALADRLLFAAQPAKVLITLRDDFLHLLERWRRLMPSMMDNRLELRLLSGPQAFRAVYEPGAKRCLPPVPGPASQVPDPDPIVAPETAQAIVRFVAGAREEAPLEEIDNVPPLLSLICQQLNARRLAAGAHVIEPEALRQSAPEILRAYYDDCFRSHPEALRGYIEDKLVSSSGFRESVTLDSALAELSALEVAEPLATLRSLVDERLLVIEERGGISRVELTHDILARLAHESRRERREREEKEAAQRRLAEEAVKARKRRVLTGVMSVLTLAALAGGLIGWQQARKAKAAAAEATQQRDEARFNEGLGWMLRAQVAEERGKEYPGTLLYAAQAIGFDGVGRPADPAEPIRFIRQERNAAAYQTAQSWIRDHPSYLPVWSSAVRSAPATGLSFSPEGRWLALSEGDGGVRLWDLTSGVESEMLEPGAIPVKDGVFHPDGSVLAIAQGDRVRFWDMKAKAFTKSELPGSVVALAYSPGGEILAGSGADGSLLLWEGGQKTVVATGQTKPASRLAYSQDNSAIAAVFPGTGLRLFFPRVGKAASAWEKNAGAFTAVTLSPDGARLAAGSADGAVSLWDVASAKLLGQVSLEQRHKASVWDLSFGPAGRQLASASEDGTLKLWDVTGDVPAITATLTGHKGAVTRVRYMPGGGLLVSAGADGSAKLWDVSGKTKTTPDLYTYLGRKWYLFDPGTQQALWAGGTGFANVPAESILGLWQAGGSGVLPFLLGAGDEAGALVALRDLPEPTRAGAAKEVVIALLADARKAADDYRWNRVDLRIGQLQQLGGVEVSALLQRRKAVAAEGADFTNGDGMDFVWCPAGSFTMGSPETEKGHQGYENQHRVKLSHGFWIGRYTVTQAQWTTVMGSNPSTYVDSGPKAPVENVSWTESVDFCRKLTDRERAKGAVPLGWEYALPTEAQWEYACRAGTSTAYSFGDDAKQLYKYGNFNDKSGGFLDADETQDDGSKYTAPVGHYLPNPWKLYDMHGNVFQWCQDALDPQNAKYPEGEEAVDPLSARGTSRVLRGGSWDDTAANCRSANRNAHQPSIRGGYLGLRPVLVPSRPSEPQAAWDGGHQSKRER